MLQAYLGDKKLKKAILAEVVKHRKADQIVQGTYGQENGIWKGCAVGCSIHSLNIKLKKDFSTSDHFVYESQLGIPKELAQIEDSLFEEMSVKDSKIWPERFLKAINPGADLSKVVAQWVIWEFEDKKVGLSQTREIQDNKEIYGWCKELVALYKRDLAGDRPTEEEYYQLYLKIDRAWAGAGAGAWAWAWAWARAWAGAGAGARAGARARARARAWAWAGARAGAGDKYRKEIMVSANKLLEILENTK